MSKRAALQNKAYMSFWRLARNGANYKATDMSGAGGLRVGGRWHAKGNPILYSAGSIALCCLETLVHYTPPSSPSMPLKPYHLIEYQIPWDCIEAGQNVELPPDWDTLPDSPAAAAVGTAWLQSQSSLLLFVPSVIIRREANALINPLHRDITMIHVVDHGVFEYDSRLL